MLSDTKSWSRKYPVAKKMLSVIAMTGLEKADSWIAAAIRSAEGSRSGWVIGATATTAALRAATPAVIWERSEMFMIGFPSEGI